MSAFSEPWSQGHYYKADVMSESGCIAVFGSSQMPRNCDLAKRAVACVNAMAGVADPAELRARSDALLAAAERFRSAVVASINNSASSPMEPDVFRTAHVFSEMINASEQLVAAIAACKEVNDA